MATLDVVTLDEVKDRLGGSVARANNDAEIEADIAALSALFDDRFGAVVKRDIVAEPVTRPWSDTVHPFGNRIDHYVTAWTDYWPIVGTPTAATGTVTVRDRAFGRVEFSVTSETISYTAGRFATTALVSEQFKAAFVVALRNWRQAAHIAPHVPPGPDYPTPRTAFPTFAMPNAATQMLSKYQRPEGVA